MEDKGWAGLRLALAIFNRDAEKLSVISQYLTSYYPDKEIRIIWRPVKILLSDEDICWLETTLDELGQFRV